MKQRFQGIFDSAKMGDQCWFRMRESDQEYNYISAFAKKVQKT